MSALTTTTAGKLGPVLNSVVNYANESLETILQNLCALGVPVLHKMDNGWYVYLKMHVSAAGTEFTIKSQSNCETPLSAARQCAERAVTTLRDWTT